MSTTIYELPELSKLYTIKPDSGFTPLKVNFTYTGGNNVIWKFGDKDSSFSKQPSTSFVYTYSSALDPYRARVMQLILPK